MNELLPDFEKRKSVLNEFAEATNQLLKSLLSHYELKPHQLTFRVKDKDSLEKKILKKNSKYNKLEEITDLVGFRIITYFEDDIDKIAELIQKEFLIDEANSIDKRKLETDKFGYRSLHFVFALKDERLKLTEYKKFKGIKAEIQIRSILQHSWAEIEHDLGYKGESEIPETARRTFYRVAALLEQADIEFVKLRVQLKDYEKTIENEINKNPENVSIDKASLLTFIKTNKYLNDIELKIENNKIIENRNPVNDYVISNVIPRLESLEIYTIKELEEKIIENQDGMYGFIENHAKEYAEKRNKKPESFVNGAGLLWLSAILENQSKVNKKNGS